MIIFALGWVSSSAYTQISYTNLQMPYGVLTGERASPSDWIKKDQIHVFNDKIIIDVQGADWAEFVDTNSMDPVIDEYANSIELHPTDPSQLSIGDIISYSSQFSDGIIIHRIIQIGFDETGWFAIVKGDNNSRQDPGKVRFEDIEGVLVGILY